MNDDSSLAPSFDQNLLFGIIAMRSGFIDSDAFVGALNAWTTDKSKPVGQILRERGALSYERRIMVQASLEEQLEKHENAVHGALKIMASMAGGSTDSDANSRSYGDESRDTASAIAPIGCTSKAVNGTSASSRFRVLRSHARGGLGEVFVAEDLELEREVALKEIQPEHAHAPSFRSRFIREAKITGGLEHPGIVPIYSLGAHTDGRPYYAMRFVNGVNLKEAIERFHGSEVTGPERNDRRVEFRQLLRRFLDMCNAVAYAHSRGVLHRDLKPGNVMLGSFGETLIVDWGLAKAVGENSEFRSQNSESDSRNEPIDTMPGAAVGTPAYMSPEQAAGRVDLIGPATDIYGLGATLYTVLTGKPAFSSADRGELLHAVRNGKFPRPRQIRPETAAALEAVCLKAMALQPADRYASALHLAADVEHWLADEPVAVYREPWRERTRRFLRKHRTLATSAVAMLVVAVLLSSGAAVLLNVARAGERQARFDEEKQKEVALLAEQSAKKEKDRAEAVSQFLVAVFRAPSPKRDGTNIKLVDVLEYAVKQLDRKFAHDPATRGRLLQAFGKTYEGLSIPGPAVKLLKQAREILRETLGADHDDTLVASTHLAMAYRAAGQWDEALRLAEEIHLLYEAKLGADNATTLGALGNLAHAYIDIGRHQDAVPLLEEIVGKLRKLKSVPDPGSTYGKMASLALAYQKTGRLADALKLHEEVHAWRKSNLGQDHLYTLHSLHAIASIYQELGRRSEAIALFEETTSLCKAKFGLDHPDTLNSMNNLATTYHELGRLSDALPLWEETSRRFKARNGPKDHQTLTSMENLGGLYRELDRHQEALTLLQEALVIRREVHPNSPALARTLAGVGVCWIDQGEYERAEPPLREALEILEKKNLRTVLRHSVEVRLGETLARQQKYADAEPLLIAGYEGLRAQENLGRAARARFVESVEWLIRLYKATGDTAKASEWEGRRLQGDPVQ